MIIYSAIVGTDRMAFMCFYDEICKSSSIWKASNFTTFFSYLCYFFQFFYFIFLPEYQVDMCKWIMSPDPLSISLRLPLKWKSTEGFLNLTCSKWTENNIHGEVFQRICFRWACLVSEAKPRKFAFGGTMLNKKKKKKLWGANVRTKKNFHMWF